MQCAETSNYRIDSLTSLKRQKERTVILADKALCGMMTGLCWRAASRSSAPVRRVQRELASRSQLPYLLPCSLLAVLPTEKSKLRQRQKQRHLWEAADVPTRDERQVYSTTSELQVTYIQNGPDQSGIKLEINSRKISVKSPNTWKIVL